MSIALLLLLMLFLFSVYFHNVCVLNRLFFCRLASMAAAPSMRPPGNGWKRKQIHWKKENRYEKTDAILCMIL